MRRRVEETEERALHVGESVIVNLTDGSAVSGVCMGWAGSAVLLVASIDEPLKHMTVVDDGAGGQEINETPISGLVSIDENRRLFIQERT